MTKVLPSITGSAPTYIADIPVHLIVIRPEAQRDLNLDRARRMADNWRPELVSTLVVNDRGDGIYSNVDGQHRHKAAELGGVPTLPCVVHTGLDVQSEALLFLELQRERKGVSPYSTYRVSVTAEEPWALAIQSVLASLALDASAATGTHRIAAIRTLEKIFQLGGIGLLHQTVSSVKDAYCPAQGRDAWAGDILYGVAKFYAKNPKADPNRLIKVLQSQTPTQWAADVAVMSKGSGGSDGRPSHLQKMLSRHYNKGLRNPKYKVLE